MRNLLILLLLINLLSCSEDEEAIDPVKPWVQQPLLEWGEEVTLMINDTLVTDPSYAGDYQDVVIYPEYEFFGDTILGTVRLSFRDAETHAIQRSVKVFESALVLYENDEFRLFCDVDSRSYDMPGRLTGLGIKESVEDDTEWNPYRPWITRFELIKKP